MSTNLRGLRGKAVLFCSFAPGFVFVFAWYCVVQRGLAVCGGWTVVRRRLGEPKSASATLRNPSDFASCEI